MPGAARSCRVPTLRIAPEAARSEPAGRVAGPPSCGRRNAAGPRATRRMGGSPDIDCESTPGSRRLARSGSCGSRLEGKFSMPLRPVLHNRLNEQADPVRIANVDYVKVGERPQWIAGADRDWDQKAQLLILEIS